MGKSIHVISDASGVILKASKDKANCEAFINGKLGNAQRVMEPALTEESDHAMLYKLPTGGNGEYRTALVLTTLRLT